MGSRSFWQWNGPLDYYLRLLYILELESNQSKITNDGGAGGGRDGKMTQVSSTEEKHEKEHEKEKVKVNGISPTSQEQELQQEELILPNTEELIETCQRMDIPEDEMGKEDLVLNYIDYLLEPDHISESQEANNNIKLWRRSMHLVLVEHLIDKSLRELALSMIRRQFSHQKGSVQALYRLRIASLLLDLDDPSYAAIEIGHASKVLGQHPDFKEEFKILSARLAFHNSRFDVAYDSIRQIPPESGLSFPLQLRVVSALLSSPERREERLRDVQETCPLGQIPYLLELVESMLSQERLIPEQIIEGISGLCPGSFDAKGCISQRTKEYFIYQCSNWHKSLSLAELSPLLGNGTDQGGIQDSITFIQTTATRFNIPVEVVLPENDDDLPIVRFEDPYPDPCDQLLNVSSANSSQSPISAVDEPLKGPRRSSVCSPQPIPSTRPSYGPELVNQKRSQFPYPLSDPKILPREKSHIDPRFLEAPPTEISKNNLSLRRSRSPAMASDKSSKRQKQKSGGNQAVRERSSSPPTLPPKNPSDDSDIEIVTQKVARPGSGSRPPYNISTTGGGSKVYVRPVAGDQINLNLSKERLRELKKSSITSSELAQAAYSAFVSARAGLTKKPHDPRHDRFLTRMRRYLRFFDLIPYASGWPVTPMKVKTWIEHDPPGRDVLISYVRSIELARKATFNLFYRKFMGLKDDRLQEDPTVLEVLDKYANNSRTGRRSSSPFTPSMRVCVTNDGSSTDRRLRDRSRIGRANSGLEDRKRSLSDTKPSPSPSTPTLSKNSTESTKKDLSNGMRHDVIVIDDDDDDEDQDGEESKNSNLPSERRIDDDSDGQSSNVPLALTTRPKATTTTTPPPAADTTTTNDMMIERKEVDLNNLPSFAEIRSSGMAEDLIEALRGVVDVDITGKLTELRESKTPIDLTGDFTDVFNEYFHFWEKLYSICWLPVLPIKVVIWLESMDPKIDEYETVQILKDFDENFEEDGCLRKKYYWLRSQPEGEEAEEHGEEDKGVEGEDEEEEGEEPEDREVVTKDKGAIDEDSEGGRRNSKRKRKRRRRNVKLVESELIKSFFDYRGWEYNLSKFENINKSHYPENHKINGNLYNGELVSREINEFDDAGHNHDKAGGVGESGLNNSYRGSSPPALIRNGSEGIETEPSFEESEFLNYHFFKDDQKEDEGLNATKSSMSDSGRGKEGEVGNPNGSERAISFSSHVNADFSGGCVKKDGEDGLVGERNVQGENEETKGERVREGKRTEEEKQKGEELEGGGKEERQKEEELKGGKEDIGGGHDKFLKNLHGLVNVFKSFDGKIV